jgi:hypothetical protein
VNELTDITSDTQYNTLASQEVKLLNKVGMGFSQKALRGKTRALKERKHSGPAACKDNALIPIFLARVAEVGLALFIKLNGLTSFFARLLLKPLHKQVR